MSRWQFAYAPLLILASAVMFLKSGIYARILSVQQFGQLNVIFLVASTVIGFGALGFNHLAHKLLPLYHLRKDSEAASKFLTAGLVVFLSVLTVGMAIALLLGPSITSFGGTEVIVIGAVSLSQLAFTMRLIWIKSEFQYLAHAAWSSLRAIALFTIGIIVALQTKDVIAIVAAEALVTGILAWPLVAKANVRSHLFRPGGVRQIREIISGHWTSALTLLRLQGTVIVLYLLDRWIGVATLSSHEYGIYAVGLIVLTSFEILQSVIAVPAFPTLSRMLADGNRRAAYTLVSRISIGILLVGLACSVPGIWILEYAVREFLPQYIESILVLKFALLAGVIRVANFFATFSILVNKEQVTAKVYLIFGSIVIVAAILARAIAGMNFAPIHIAILAVVVSMFIFFSDFTVAFRAARRSEPLGGAR
jgi:O-antigen/teichoic acid export membrane protein